MIRVKTLKNTCNLCHVNCYTSGIPSFQLPKDPLRQQAWFSSLLRRHHPDDVNLFYSIGLKEAAEFRICARHFLPSSIIVVSVNGRLKFDLFSNAVPTLIASYTWNRLYEKPLISFGPSRMNRDKNCYVQQFSLPAPPPPVRDDGYSDHDYYGQVKDSEYSSDSDSIENTPLARIKSEPSEGRTEEIDGAAPAWTVESENGSVPFAKIKSEPCETTPNDHVAPAWTVTAASTPTAPDDDLDEHITNFTTRDQEAIFANIGRILDLFRVCHESGCGAEISPSNSSTTRCAYRLIVNWKCNSGHSGVWSNFPVEKDANQKGYHDHQRPQIPQYTQPNHATTSKSSAILKEPVSTQDGPKMVIRWIDVFSPTRSRYLTLFKKHGWSELCLPAKLAILLKLAETYTKYGNGSGYISRTLNMEIDRDIEKIKKGFSAIVDLPLACNLTRPDSDMWTVRFNVPEQLWNRGMKVCKDFLKCAAEPGWRKMEIMIGMAEKHPYIRGHIGRFVEPSNDTGHIPSEIIRRALIPQKPSPKKRIQKSGSGKRKIKSSARKNQKRKRPDLSEITEKVEKDNDLGIYRFVSEFQEPSTKRKKMVLPNKRAKNQRGNFANRKKVATPPPDSETETTDDGPSDHGSDPDWTEESMN